MAQIFPKWTNHIPTILAVVGFLGLVGAVGFVWYYFSPWYTDVGYRPVQPVPYSHKLHAGDLAIDCRYCHTGVETQAHANVPPTQTCMNCHTMVKADSDKLALVRESYQTRQPIEWIRIHNLPDYAYFNHSVHVRAGVGCISCHGNIAEMEVVKLAEPLSMGWCLDCHRNPDPHLRPVSEVTNMYWTAPDDHAEWVKRMKEEKDINPPDQCSACHH
ncbi:cytochrome C [candidate division GN15 bacterium]|nr:cytochrome C [candidate division GN15 bacterium]